MHTSEQGSTDKFVDDNPGSLRLVGGRQRLGDQGQPYFGGRLEIYLMGQWGTVCGEGFDDAEGQLACNQLGFRSLNGTGIVGSFQGNFGQW